MIPELAIKSEELVEDYMHGGVHVRVFRPNVTEDERKRVEAELIRCAVDILVSSKK